MGALYVCGRVLRNGWLWGWLTAGAVVNVV